MSCTSFLLVLTYVLPLTIVAQHLEKLRDFWSMMDNLDKSLWVVDPRNPSRAATHRQINIGELLFTFMYIVDDIFW